MTFCLTNIYTVHHFVTLTLIPTFMYLFPFLQEYANAGAVIQEDISEAPVIFGVKQIPIDLLEPEKTYVFFSHTIKAQEANMPLLDACIEKVGRIVN